MSSPLPDKVHVAVLLLHFFALIFKKTAEIVHEPVVVGSRGEEVISNFVNAAIAAIDVGAHCLALGDAADLVASHPHVADRHMLNFTDGDNILCLEPPSPDVVVGKLLEAVLQNILNHVE